MRPATLVAIAFDRRDAAIASHADLETNVGFGPPAMGDEGLLAIDHEAHRTPDLAGEQRCNQFDIERLGGAAKAAADMRLDHADAPHVPAKDLAQPRDAGIRPPPPPQ